MLNINWRFGRRGCEGWSNKELTCFKLVTTLVPHNLQPAKIARHLNIYNFSVFSVLIITIKKDHTLCWIITEDLVEGVMKVEVIKELTCLKLATTLVLYKLTTW